MAADDYDDRRRTAEEHRAAFPNGVKKREYGGDKIAVVSLNCLVQAEIV